jgi:hypothetical protein
LGLHDRIPSAYIDYGRVIRHTRGWIACCVQARVTASLSN